MPGQSKVLRRCLFRTAHMTWVKGAVWTRRTCHMVCFGIFKHAHSTMSGEQLSVTSDSRSDVSIHRSQK